MNKSVVIAGSSSCRELFLTQKSRVLLEQHTPLHHIHRTRTATERKILTPIQSSPLPRHTHSSPPEAEAPHTLHTDRSTHTEPCTYMLRQPQHPQQTDGHRAPAGCGSWRCEVAESWGGSQRALREAEQREAVDIHLSTHLLNQLHQGLGPKLLNPSFVHTRTVVHLGLPLCLTHAGRGIF